MKNQRIEHNKPMNKRKENTNKIKKSTNGHSFREDELRNALYDIEDILGRGVCDFVLLMETAKSLVEGEGQNLKGDGIYIGVLKKNITESNMATFKFYLDASKNVVIHDKGFDYQWGEVPIHVQIIARHYKYFDYPDVKFYMASEYKVPNPFSEYWKARYLIR